MRAACDAHPSGPPPGVCVAALEFVTTDLVAFLAALESRGWVRIGVRHLCPDHSTPPRKD